MFTMLLLVANLSLLLQKALSKALLLKALLVTVLLFQVHCSPRCQTRRHPLGYSRHKTLISQSVEEIDQSVEFFVSKIGLPDMPMNEKVLVFGHCMASTVVIEAHRIAQRFEVSLVHIRRSFCDVAQAWHAKATALAGDA